MTISNDVFDTVNQFQTGLHDLDDGALAHQISLADRAVSDAAAALDDLQDQIERIAEAGGRTSVPDKLAIEERTQAQVLRMAQLNQTTARDELRRRQEAAQADAAQQAQVARAQQLAELRAQAWQQYVRDAGHRLDGVSLADESTFTEQWNAYLVDLALGRVTLPA